ncbi:MAG TPA: DNA cytosine methyltransferase [Candidatus Cloacimonadota bacterium]|nr:DNA cytosine methyltransferase [Candidatus Cloacimonadota bacterium]
MRDVLYYSELVEYINSLDADKAASFTHYLHSISEKTDKYSTNRDNLYWYDSLPDFKSFIWDVPFPPVKNPKFTFIDLFAGIGGMRIAFQNNGGQCLFSSEYDKAAQKSYEMNYGEVPFGDITQIDSDDIPDHDILIAGFPCQAFSIAGYQKGFEDPRGNMFFETARIIHDKKPRAFLLENVKNLVSHDHGKTFQVIKKVLKEELGYSFIPFVLNSKDYGQVPQTRERIYMVGFRNEAKYDNYENNIGVYHFRLDKEYRTLLKNREMTNISTMNFKIPVPLKLTIGISDLLEKEKQPEMYYYQPEHIYYPILHEIITKKHTIYQWRRVYVRENKSNVCPTLTANMGTGGHNVPIIHDEYGIRKLTPRECARFQGYEDKFVLPKLANSHLYKQIGNSVTVPVIERIAHEIVSALEL